MKSSMWLLQFVDEKVQWMHIDMAGPVWNDKKRAATGFGISTLVEWVLKNSSQSGWNLLLKILNWVGADPAIKYVGKENGK